MIKVASKHGGTLKKCIEVLKTYGEIYGADGFVECTSCHFVTSCGLRFVKSMFSILQELHEAELRCKGPLTANPRPLDSKVYPLLEKIAGKLLYGKQKKLENLLLDLGLIDRDAFTCTPYYIGNKPKYGEVLAWAESSAVIYANSVLGARTNRNSSIIEIISGVLGKTPRFGLLIDENRKADWLIEVKTSARPNPFVLGALIGKIVVDGVPYITGLDRWDYKEYELKDMGAAAAAWGAVALFHAEGLTPEAVEKSRALLKDDHSKLVVDDAKLYEMMKIMASRKEKKFDLAVIGCPHLSREQLEDWAKKVEGLKLKVKTWFLAAPGIAKEFKASKMYATLKEAGADVISVCPLMFTNIPTSKRLSIITNSAKLSYYSHAFYAGEHEIIEIIAERR